MRRDALRLAEGAHRCDVFPLARDHRAPRPLPIGLERRETLKLRHHDLRLRDRVPARRKNLDTPPCHGVERLPRAARRVLGADLVDVDGTPGLHPLPRRLDHRVGGLDDVAGGAVVTDEIGSIRPVIRFEATDELDRGAAEGVDVLVVVADGEERELAVLVLPRAPSERRDQVVLRPVDVLILVHQYPAEPCQKPLPLLIGLFRQQALAAQQRCRAAHHLIEHLVVGSLGPASEARAREPHGEPVAGEHGHAARVVADQRVQAAADVDRRVAVIGKRQDAARILPPHADQVGDAMHQHPSLAGARAGQHQHVGLLAVVGDDALLLWVAQALDDGPP